MIANQYLRVMVRIALEWLARAQFDRFLQHPNHRVRDLAQRVLDEQRRDSKARQRMREEDEAL